jgi:hypothetical protein
METSWQRALWLQVGAAIDMLEDAVAACPEALWREPLWRMPAADRRPNSGMLPSMRSSGAISLSPALTRDSRPRLPSA